MPYHSKPKKKNGKKKKKNGKKKKSGNGLTAAQKKLPMALQRAILKRKKKICCSDNVCSCCNFDSTRSYYSGWASNTSIITL